MLWCVEVGASFRMCVVCGWQWISSGISGVEVHGSHWLVRHSHDSYSFIRPKAPVRGDDRGQHLLSYSVFEVVIVAPGHDQVLRVVVQGRVLRPLFPVDVHRVGPSLASVQRARNHELGPGTAVHVLGTLAVWNPYRLGRVQCADIVHRIHLPRGQTTGSFTHRAARRRVQKLRFLHGPRQAVVPGLVVDAVGRPVVVGCTAVRVDRSTGEAREAHFVVQFFSRRAMDSLRGVRLATVVGMPQATGCVGVPQQASRFCDGPLTATACAASTALRGFFQLLWLRPSLPVVLTKKAQTISSIFEFNFRTLCDR